MYYHFLILVKKGDLRMAECHDLFNDFHAEIHLSSTKKESLRTSRNAIRDKVKKYFKEDLKKKTPLFYGQGSYMMNTTINPLDGEYDIDDGIYLEHLKDIEEEQWEAPATVHNWIVNATKDHTSTPPVDKNTCVRVIYKANYHVDLPIYVKKEGQTPKLAHKTLGWIESDPKGFTTWFNDQVKEKGDQLKRIVRFLKAWKDNKQGDTKFPSGMVLTVLATNHYVNDYAENDDSALVATAKAIHEALSDNFSVSRPIQPNEELLDNWSDTKKDNFLTKLEKLVSEGQAALEEDDKEKASKKWIKHFGDRFPKYEPPNEEEEKSNEALVTKSAAVLGNHDRFA